MVASGKRVAISIAKLKHRLSVAARLKDQDRKYLLYPQARI
jgi:hypothetical protein